VRERDRVTRPHSEAATAGELVDRPRDDPKPHPVKLAEKRGDLARQSAIDERLEQDGLGAVLALVHRDELGEDGIRALAARSPALDPPDQPLRSAAQSGVDETFLRRCVQVHRAGRDVRAARDFANAEVRISAARDLAERGRLDRARCSSGPARSVALDVFPIRYKSSVPES
jgi:hypothetical protein